jgi:hypothetical protein
MLVAQPDWIPARLFTTAGLRGAHEQEVRASAALMSILGAVPRFSRALLKRVGAPGGRIETFTEVILKTRSGDTLRPDGVVLATRASSRSLNTRWRITFPFSNVHTGNRRFWTMAF